MLTATAFSILYLSMVLFYHSNKKRTSIHKIKQTQGADKFLRLLAWLTLIFSTYLLVIANGAEIGITLWLALITLAAIVSMMVATFTQKSHLGSVILITLTSYATALVMG